MNHPQTDSRNSRATAARIVQRWLETEEFPDRLIERVDQDHAFVMEVVLGIARQRRALEWLIDRCVAQRPVGPPFACLLVGLYQLFMMDSVAEYAAVNETVAAVKIMGGRGASGLVNAVLRRATREKAALLGSLQKQKPGIRESHPDILLRRWSQHYGEDAALELCRWNNTRPSVTVVACSHRTTAESLLATWKDAGIETSPHPYAPDRCLVLPSGTPPNTLPGYGDGLFTIQDPATLAAVDLLAPEEGERVLDACAAPGGKTAMIATRMADRGALIAMDLHEDRLAVLRENLRRLKLGSVQVVRGDAARPRRSGLMTQEPFDRILLDVPCSNTGVLRRRPDARWRFTESRMRSLVDTQRQMLHGAALLLKPGGLIVFSTCSLEPEEGSVLIEGWLKDNSAFVLEKNIELWPPAAGTDGVFAAAVRHRG